MSTGATSKDKQRQGSQPRTTEELRNFSYAFVMSHGDLRLIIAYTENILKKLYH